MPFDRHKKKWDAMYQKRLDESAEMARKCDPAYAQTMVLSTMAISVDNYFRLFESDDEKENGNNG